MSKAIDVRDLSATFNAGHMGSIYSANQAGVQEALERVQASDADLAVHPVVVAKTRDGTSHFLVRSDESTYHVTGLSSGKPSSMLDNILPADQQALHAWAADQMLGESGAIDLMRWPGWPDAIARKIAAKE